MFTTYLLPSRVKPSGSISKAFARAVYDFQVQGSANLCFNCGDIIEVQVTQRTMLKVKFYIILGDAAKADALRDHFELFHPRWLRSITMAGGMAGLIRELAHFLLLMSRWVVANRL